MDNLENYKDSIDNIVILSFGRSGSSYLIDLLKNYDSYFEVISIEVNINNYIHLIDNKNNIICKYVFDGSEDDNFMLKYFKDKNYKFILLDRNCLETHISDCIEKKNNIYSNFDTSNSFVDLKLIDIYNTINYRNSYYKMLNNFSISYIYVLYEDLLKQPENLKNYINDLFSNLFSIKKIYFDGINKSTFIKQNNNVTNLSNVISITNDLYIKNTETKIIYNCDNNLITTYYEKNVKIKKNNCKNLYINIIDCNYYLIPNKEIDLFYENNKNYICLYDNKIVLVAFYDINNTFEIINNNELFLNYNNYDLQSNLEKILNKYENNISLLKHNDNPIISDIENSFIIHINGNEERLKYIIKNNYIKRLYLVDAIIYKNDLLVQKFASNLLYRNFYNKEFYENNKYNSYTTGAICLTLTNLIILKYCIKNNIENLIIFEDDLVPHKNLQDIQLYFNNKPPDSNLIYLSIKQDFREKLNYYNDYFYYRNKYSWSTLSYCVLGLESIKTLIEYYSTFLLPIDCYTFNELKCYISSKNFFIDDENIMSNIKSVEANKKEVNNIWNYNFDNYDFNSVSYNFVLFNYKNNGNNIETWKNFAYNLYTNSNKELYINYENSSINENTIVFFDFVDREFGWDYWMFEKKYKDGVPFKWGGIIHHPFELQSYWGNNIAVNKYLNIEHVRKSLKNCKFLIVLSDALKDEIIESKIIEEFSIPIYTIYHITPLFNFNFNISNYYLKENLLFLGWSFRNVNLFYRINTKLKKIMLPGLCNKEQKDRFNKIMYKQTDGYNENNTDVTIHDYLSSCEFLNILSSSVVFLDFDGVSANNSVVECIKFNIPLIIRKCKAVIFYLGENYPMYYENENDINSIMNNLDIKIKETICYLERLDKNKFLLTPNIINVLNIIQSHQSSTNELMKYVIKDCYEKDYDPYTYEFSHRKYCFEYSFIDWYFLYRKNSIYKRKKDAKYKHTPKLILVGNEKLYLHN